MTEILQPIFHGISAQWPKRQAIVKSLRRLNLRSMQPIIEYNNRQDSDNPINVVPSVDYGGVGRDLQFSAIALALEEQEWLPTLARSTAYRLLANKLNYFWHENFRILYKEDGRVLNMFNANLAITDMAFAFMLGWNEEAVHHGYLIYAVLNRGHYLPVPYENEHRRAHAFTLRLFADWRGDVSHDWPKYGYDEPIYNQLLQRWREPDPALLVPLLIAACDRHTHEAKVDTSKAFYDFGDYTLMRTPIEIVMLLRLREMHGLENPVIDHPLMEAPFMNLPAPQPPYQADDFMQGTLKRVRQDWPLFDNIVALDTIRNNKGRSG